MNILFTSSGRRVALLNYFKQVYQQQYINGKVITADLKNNAPSAYFSDKHMIVPNISSPNYLEELIKICKQESIHLIIPLIDTELTLLAKNRHLFEEAGVKVLVSSVELNEIASDKKKTFQFFVENSILTPKVYTSEELEDKAYKFPLLIKPLDGSSSKGVTKIYNEKELIFFREYIPNAMVQEYVEGTEYTVDVMVDFKGNIKTIVPRMRIETRAGEVSKGVTEKDTTIINAVEEVVNLLPQPAGCLTLQCFKKSNGEITFIEINPRFGGGIPLSIQAGANFPLWTIQASKGEIFNVQDYSWQENLTMLRFDEAVYTESIQYAN
ncbi:ATP-grasp domain-containing protein [Metabacillus rhizolycopersici]|uniref:ATP-grasp domain-containing protein n=1 Tax=Metabacillus rhizolycopersici TaxID=2875709 RepID=A0ABS7UNT8_9BACI|nr:ATP-grasp domain-containing protein [Metabacillus rhizolycopersici]MBZ5749702.1 ATP-grasp domain-containing protein [Metabacillus rhizolycopersici]